MKKKKLNIGLMNYLITYLKTNSYHEKLPYYKENKKYTERHVIILIFVPELSKAIIKGEKRLYI